MKSALLCLLLVPALEALRCYDYSRSSTYQNNLHSWQECPYDTHFCFKTYIESFDQYGQRTYVESRSCGTPNVCQRDGCMGSDRDKACCCKNDLCNSAMTATSVPMIMTTAAAAYLFR